MLLLLPLLVAGLPGLVRLFFIILAEKSLSIQEFGQLSSDLSVVILVSFFTTIGWCGLLLVRLPKLQEKDKWGYFKKIRKVAAVSVLASFVFLYLLKLHGGIYSILGVCVLLIGWSAYQLRRHFFLANKEYKNIIAIDLISFVSFSILAYFFGMGDGLALLGVGYLTLLIYRIHILDNSVLGNLDKADYKFSLNVGLTNFLSGSVVMLFIPYCSVAYGIEYAALIGFIVSLLGIVLLVPRALASFYTPDLSKNYNNAVTMLSIYNKFSVLTYSALVFILFFLFVFITLFFERLFEGLSGISGAADIFYSFSLLIFFQQLSLPGSVLLISLEKSKVMLFSNVIYMVAFIFVLIIDSLSMGVNSISKILLLLSILSFIRFLVIEVCSRRLLAGVNEGPSLDYDS